MHYVFKALFLYKNILALILSLIYEITKLFVD